MSAEERSSTVSSDGNKNIVTLSAGSESIGINIVDYLKNDSYDILDSIYNTSNSSIYNVGGDDILYSGAGDGTIYGQDSDDELWGGRSR